MLTMLNDKIFPMIDMEFLKSSNDKKMPEQALKLPISTNDNENNFYNNS